MRKVAIIGTAPLSRDLAPYQDKDWEIWVCSAGNVGAAGVTRVTRWYELHAITELEAPENKSWAGPYLRWIREQTFPIYMLEKNDHVPQAMIFPGKELLARFGREWFSSSVAWMQAHAIHEQVDEIAIFGVDMAADHEHYTGQRAGCRRFIEIAKEHGINTTIPWESCLGNPPPVYGYCEATPMGRRINVTEAMLVQKRAEIAQNEERMRMEKCFFDGALEQLRYFKRTFLDGADAFDHIGLSKDLDEAAKASVNNQLGSAPMAVPTNGSIAPSAANLTPPPPVDDVREDAVRALYGADSGSPSLPYPDVQETPQRPSVGHREAI